MAHRFLAPTSPALCKGLSAFPGQRWADQTAPSSAPVEVLDRQPMSLCALGNFDISTSAFALF